MVNFQGSCSGMAIGMHVTASPAQSVFSNTFHAIDAEVDGKVLVIDRSGGAAPAKNTWISGQWAYATCAIDASAGADNLIVNGNLGGVNDFCPGGAAGVTVIGPTHLPSTLNTLKDLGLSATNGVAVWPSLGASSGFNFHNGTAYFSNQAPGLPNAYAVTATGSHVFWVGASNVLSVGPASVSTTLPVRLTPMAIASLPACDAARVGSIAMVRNGVAAPTFHQAVSETGPASWAVACATNGATYAWVYD
jgi:hypothetical protein